MKTTRAQDNLLRHSSQNRPHPNSGQFMGISSDKKTTLVMGANGMVRHGHPVERNRSVKPPVYRRVEKNISMV